MANRYISFDLQIAALIPDDAQDWKAFRPLGITCAAIAFMSSEGEMFAYPFWGSDLADNNKPFAARMSQPECAALVKTLQTAVDDGFTILGHNTVSFDFDILAEESGMHAECVELAMGSADLCFQTLCVKGYPIGLDAVCKGMGLEGKTPGMDGAKAPQMWADGKYDEVLRYVAQDARCTLEVALEIEKHRLLRWVSQKGRLKTQIMPRLLPVREALQLPEPNTDWMDSPRSRESFTEWMKP